MPAEVVEYREENGPFRNDYRPALYSYVRIMHDQRSPLAKLHYSQKTIKPFTIGETVDVFWDGGKLLYWNAYDKGIYAYVPSNWNFLRKKDSN